MQRQSGQRWGGFDLLGLVSLTAFFSSVPLLLAPLYLLQPLLSLTTDAPVLEPLAATPLLTSMALAAMFTSLAMLFVCLLKTAYARLDRFLLVVATVAYLLGMAILCAAPFIADIPSPLITLAGVPVGFGAAILCMAWARSTHLPNFRIALVALVALGLVVFGIDALMSLLDARIRAVVLLLLSLVGGLGCLRCALGASRVGDRATTTGSNWWDVFGRLDMSLLEGGSDFATPLSRVLFFIATPTAVFLLFVIGMNMHHTSYGAFPLEIVGGVLAVVCAAPLLFVKSERGMINLAYRFYLPSIAVVVFVVGDFAAPEARSLLLNVGVYTFCFVYGLLMCAMIVTMLSRMKSLALPAACMLVIASCFIALLSYANIDAGALEAFRFNVLLGLLVLSVLLLVVMPSSRIWRVVLEGVDASSTVEDATPYAKPRVLALEERCDLAATAYNLTPREGEILRFLGRGYGSSYIADELVIADSTVRSHVKSIYRKMDVSSRSELIGCIDEMGEDASAR